MLCKKNSISLKMSEVNEILSYKKNPDEDFYGLLNCDENSTVSLSAIIIIFFFFVLFTKAFAFFLFYYLFKRSKSNLSILYSLNLLLNYLFSY